MKLKELLQIQPAAGIDPSQSILLMETGDDHLFFGTLNQANRQIEQAWYYVHDDETPNNLHENVFEKHQELKGSYYQAIIGYNFPQSLLVPEKFHKKEQAENLLENIYGKGVNTIVISETVIESEILNIYRVPQIHYSWINNHFTSAKTWHTYSAGIKSMQLFPGGASQLTVMFSPQKIIIYAIKNEVVQLVQSYNYETPDDVLYYVLKIVHLLGILQQDVKVELAGLIDEQSAIYKKLHEYFTQISFAGLPDNMRVHENLSESPVHFFSTLFKLAACVS